ncbi:dihydrofolate reductase family protein [Nocardia wallacei]|uniref:dihydrofolate reductase family protein n=1 Tax=Nocardia wallacei TaxID=480035 RepID=UPI0024538605|nr:dihydrofolate reductase family protein [Nocardia wallacei]
MGKIIHFVAQSLDGYIEGPNGEFDWPVMDPELSEYSRVAGDEADAFLYGRVVWDMMSSYWPKAEEISDHPHDLEFAPMWRAKPKVVLSRTLRSADWNTRVVHSPEELAAIKNDEDKTFIIFGGSDMAASLTRLGLIDEYRIFVHPVLLGGGKPVFTDTKLRAALRLVESRTFDNQVVMLRHERVA